MTDRSVIPIYAIIPAAGASRRMGRHKLLIRTGGQTLIDRVLDAVVDGGVTRVVVVGRDFVEEHLALRSDNSVAVIRNDDPSTEMIDSVRLGLQFWRRSIGPRESCGFLVTPADLPGLSAEDVRACVDAFCRRPDAIVIGHHGGRRGHPLIFPGKLSNEVGSSICDQGLNGLQRAHSDLIVEAKMPTSGGIIDVDEPEDLKPFDV